MTATTPIPVSQSRQRTAAPASLSNAAIQSEQRDRLILDSVRDYAIFMVDHGGRIQTWPPGAEAVYGWTAEEAIGQDVAVTFLSRDCEDGVPAFEREKALQHGVTPNVRWHLRKDGSHVFIEGSVRLIRDPDAPAAHSFLWVGQDATERRQWAQRQKVLVAELQHRTRNLMSVVLSITDKTLRRSADLADFRPRFRSRIDALARVQGLLSRLNEYDRVTFDELIRTELSAIDDHGDQVTLDGPMDINLRSSTVQTLAMALHELTTNAVKYGALKQPAAKLAVTWSRTPPDAEGTAWLHVDWRESGVDMPPANAAPRGSGQGRELIERALPYQLGARTSYNLEPDGVHCTIDVPLSASPKHADEDG